MKYSDWNLSATSSTTNLSWNGLESKSDLRSERETRVYCE